MARQARSIAADCPHHITHRGNLRAAVFFCDEDRRFYLSMLGECARRFGMELWAYCLLDNHVHMIGRAHDGRDLRSRQLISDAEYQAKRQTIVDEL